MQEPLYLDYAATTRCHPRVLESMSMFFTEHFGNPSSPHRMGKMALHAVNKARLQVARMMGARPEEIVFTSGATESNNIAVLGAFRYEEKAPLNAVFCPIDHKSTVEVAKELRRRGVDVRYVKVLPNGRIDLQSLAELVDGTTRLVSVCHVNSEIGTKQDLEAISEICGSRDLVLHIDAAQSFGKVALHLEDGRIDCVSISGHKIGGPKGIGALYVRQSARAKLRPITFGGSDHGLRSGTLPTPLIVGLGEASELRASADFQNEWQMLASLRNLLLEILLASGAKFNINSCLDASIPHILNLRFQGVRAETLISSLDEVCIASGSACNSNSHEPSYILKGIGLSDEDANCSVRISLYPGVARLEIEGAARIIGTKVAQLQSLVSAE